MVDDNKQLSKMERIRHKELIDATIAALDSSEFTVESLQQTLNNLLEQTGEKPGTLFSLIRFAITWAPFSPALPETMATLGKQKVLDRLHAALSAA